ncbi:CBS domain-containing protein [Echinimonas agarilytica]|uniref:CBS domain-containing protein n=1 Tax=Echinimonas agarilytica TaxID=1215918 RepID=A0AA41W804_9GAMM|nr:CBS domain-containing protein [Echinimonas agarilytica]MCM2680162.1 CBS domain-containing protein [Echinimonas agarilytica]
MATQIQEIMNTTLFTLKANSSLAEAKHLMAEHPIRHIPIVSDAHHLLGLVSHRDVLATGGMHNTEHDLITLDQIMVTNPYTISPKTGIKQGARLLKRQRYGCLPVIEHNKLVGLVTASDFVEVAINLIEMIEDVEPVELDDE